MWPAHRMVVRVQRSFSEFSHNFSVDCNNLQQLLLVGMMTTVVNNPFSLEKAEKPHPGPAAGNLETCMSLTLTPE
jgi:hypothetical protein